ncbi:hypothetical protein FHL15_008694 [Xylaria flabelliformis]|uniref:Uncharacterized protein n=1 Tax=Xylaria flabelliformis TaxID=2512241 RepID=A0A553HQV1_9PEZI|nr:hypothetical protein FHL15_008694 [Xylaria flabelliformis]
MSDEDDEIQVEAPELAEDDPMRAFLPASFGKKSQDADVAAQMDRSRRTIDKHTPHSPKPQSRSRGSGSNASRDGDGDSDDDSDSDEDEDEDEYPTSHEMVIKTHDRAVTTLSLDPAGGRLISGSIDCTVKLHDFSSMTPTTIRAFKSVDPFESKRSTATSETHPINHIEFNPLAGGVFLCVSAHPQAKIMTRDGDILAEFVKGDMYLRDMNHTKGHVSEVTTGTWHPTDKNICVTAGTDSTLRIWDINNKRCQKEVLVFKSRAVGTAGRSRMTAVAWGTPAQGGSNILVSAALDGTLIMWSGNGPFSRPTAEIREAHKPNTWTGGIDISSDGRMVVTRGGDNLIKLWDTRKFKEPLVSVEHQSTSDEYPMTNIKYGPNATSIITGSRTGHLHILNPGNLRPEYTTPITVGVPLITVDWHPKINQIVTGSANGETHVLYNPTMSTRGAVDVMSRAPKRRHVDDNPEFTTDLSLGLSGESIVTPGGLPGTRGTGIAAPGKSKDPRRPQVPQQTPFMRSQPDEKHISESIPLSRMLHEDPREALLKYADVAKKDPMFTNAWKETQPVTQYADVSDDEEDGPDKKRVKR